MKNGGNESDNKRLKDRSPSPAIKSTAVVKYTSVLSPAGYSQLQCNTDLNLPPSNWGAAHDSYGLKQILTRGTGLSSFRMAHMFPDTVGEMDVISSAECIKKLLKLPYQPKGTVSMIVHRVNNTLLIDDFDVYDYLMKSEWSWLKDFFYENVIKTMTEQERMTLMIENKSHSALQLTSKFLLHSVASLPPPQEEAVLPATTSMYLEGPFLPEPETRPTESPPEHLFNRNVSWTFEDIHMLIGSDLPIFGGNDRPCVSLRLRDSREPINVLTGIDFWLDNLMCNVPEVLMCYHLDGIVQKYEPIKTEDLPNMEDSRFSPKVIRNVAQNILSFLKSNATKAGHTYWLFKGPHDEVVKLYDLTSLCPDAVDSPFTTPVAMLLYRVARNMRLTNRTKHVKQLLSHSLRLLEPRRHAHIVASAHYMLADLLLPAGTNPAEPTFKDESSSESDAEDSETEHFKAHESRDVSPDLSVSPEVPPETESVTPDVSADVTPDVSADVTPDMSADVTPDVPPGAAALVHASGLDLRNIGARVHTTNTGRQGGGRRRRRGSGPAEGAQAEGTPARCGRALRHALRGLRALRHVHAGKCEEEERERIKQQIINEEQHPTMANPYEPIKMNYEPLKTKNTSEHQSRRRRRRDRKNHAIEKSNHDVNAILVHKDKNVFPSFHEPNKDDNFAWKLHLKTLLYEKICLAYATLAEYSYANEQYGFTLKYIDMASKCQGLLSNMIIKSRVVDASCLIGRVGDSYFQMSKQWSRRRQFLAQLAARHEVDERVLLQLQADAADETIHIAADEFPFELSVPECMEDALRRSHSAYSAAAAAAAGGGAGRRGELLRRRASVGNELAVRLMNHAQQIFTQYVEETENEETDKGKELLEQFTETSKSSLEYLEEATRIFEEVNDVPNLALLYCNKGRYLRFKAHCDIDSTLATKRALYCEAEELYQRALRSVQSVQSVQSVEHCGELGDLVRWELSCHLYTRAALLQDEGVDAAEAAEALREALKWCSLGAGARQLPYQYRAANIHHRLGSLHHAQYRSCGEGARRRWLAAAHAQYEAAARLFALVLDLPGLLAVLLEHVALWETHANVTPNLKLKSLQTALQLLRQSHSIMKVVTDRTLEEANEIARAEEQQDKSTKLKEPALLALFENRLHFILKSIIQYCRSKPNKDYEKMTDMYKKFYLASLKIKKDTEDIRNYARSISDVLSDMDDISKQFE